MKLYDAYLAGWHACDAGVDGRYKFCRPDECSDNPALNRAWTLGWSEAFDREEEDDEPLPADWLDLENWCR
jgi:hypothetical protein